MTEAPEPTHRFLQAAIDGPSCILSSEYWDLQFLEPCSSKTHIQASDSLCIASTNMATSAATRISSTFDILHQIGTEVRSQDEFDSCVAVELTPWPQIHNRQALYSLCRVSKTFHEVFTPFLYAELVVPAPPAAVALQHNPHLKHVRSLDCQKLKDHGKWHGRRLLRQMPLLRQYTYETRVCLGGRMALIRI